MSGKKLSRVKGLPPETVACLQQHDIITCRDLLTQHPLELMDMLDFSYLQVQSLLSTVSKSTAPQPISALSMYQSRKEGNSVFLATSLQKLDNELRGGLPPGTITEIAGPPGTGKTQLCIMLSIVTSIPTHLGGLGAAVVFIDTEGAFTAERLVEMAQAKYTEYYSTPEHLSHLTGSVRVFTEMTCAGLMRRFEQLEEIVAGEGVGLIVVDSITSLVRKEFDTRSSKSMNERIALLSKQAAILKFLAESFQIPVVVTNQITTHVSYDTTRSSDWSECTSTGELESERGVVTAALGNSWAHCVNTRLLLQYTQGRQRKLTIAKSPLSGGGSFAVSIEKRGPILDCTATSELQQCQLTGDPTVTPLAVHPATGDGK